MKIGVIGVGKMATAIIHGLKKSQYELVISGSSQARSKEIAEQLSVAYANNHQELIDQVDLVIVGIKPQLFETVLSPLTFTKPIISMAAGITLNKLASFTNTQLPLIRIMPNINAQILKSTTALCYNKAVSEQLEVECQKIVESFGDCHIIAEKDFDTFTALAGSSPAYIYLFIEALAKAGLKHGIPKNKALDIVAQTVLASSQNLLEGNETPHDLIDKISSPGGTTVAGLLDLEKNGLTPSIISAIDTTINRAQELSKE